MMRKVVLYALVGSVLVAFTWVFVTAYSHESKTTLVTIDSVGEANLELFMLVCLWVMVGWECLDYYRTTEWK